MVGCSTDPITFHPFPTPHPPSLLSSPMRAFLLSRFRVLSRIRNPEDRYGTLRSRQLYFIRRRSCRRVPRRGAAAGARAEGGALAPRASGARPAGHRLPAGDIYGPWLRDGGVGGNG